MSAFLGPIHFWVYNKIQFQNELVKKLSEMIAEKGYDKEILLLMNKNCGELENGSLEEIIDTNNIHGWLQERVSLVEDSLAFLVTSLVGKNPEAVKDIMETARSFGESRKFTGAQTVDEVYKYLDSVLLNGMPCDRVISLVSKDDKSFVWKQEMDIHSSYWDAYQGDVKYYYDIRDNIISGILKDSGVNYTKTEDAAGKKYSLVKEG